jgi:hypothetical protein
MPEMEPSHVLAQLNQPRKTEMCVLHAPSKMDLELRGIHVA